jgi:hypothetical protein
MPPVFDCLVAAVDVAWWGIHRAACGVARRRCLGNPLRPFSCLPACRHGPGRRWWTASASAFIVQTEPVDPSAVPPVLPVLVTAPRSPPDKRCDRRIGSRLPSGPTHVRQRAPFCPPSPTGRPSHASVAQREAARVVNVLRRSSMGPSMLAVCWQLARLAPRRAVRSGPTRWCTHTARPPSPRAREWRIDPGPHSQSPANPGSIWCWRSRSSSSRAASPLAMCPVGYAIRRIARTAQMSQQTRRAVGLKRPYAARSRCETGDLVAHANVIDHAVATAACREPRLYAHGHPKGAGVCTHNAGPRLCAHGVCDSTPADRVGRATPGPVRRVGEARRGPAGDDEPRQTGLFIMCSAVLSK